MDILCVKCQILHKGNCFFRENVKISANLKLNAFLYTHLIISPNNLHILISFLFTAFLSIEMFVFAYHKSIDCFDILRRKGLLNRVTHKSLPVTSQSYDYILYRAHSYCTGPPGTF